MARARRLHKICLPILLAVLGRPAVADGPRPWGRGEDSLVFSEVHYHPLGDEKEDEFVEILNTGVHWVELGGWRIQGGVEFDFPPGSVIAPSERLVVAGDPDRLATRAPRATVLGALRGRLGNRGEILELRTRTGRLAAWVHYRDGRGRAGGGWPRRPDGRGPSLELVRPDLGSEHPRVWGPSRERGGTPGREPTARPETETRRARSAGSLRINEVATGSGGFVEVYNRGRSTARLTGLRLVAGPGATGGQPLSGSVRAGRVLAIRADKLGDLLSAPRDWMAIETDDGLLIDCLPLRGSPPGGSLGRWPDGRKESYVVPRASPGRPNRRPDLPAVVITEILYHGAEGDKGSEFIELHNIGSDTVELAGWRVDGGVRFDFPDGARIAAGGYSIIARDPDRWAAGRPGAPPTPVHGPLRGKLSNRGEEVEILDAAGNEVDRVEYEDRPPWPRDADGRGFSLELIDPGLDNEVAQAWTLGRHGGSPGRANTRARDEMPPVVARVDHDPAVPGPGDDVVVRARVVSGRRLSEVAVLHYMILADGSRSRVSRQRMNDRGRDGDGTEGDGRYAATVSVPRRMPEGAVVGYRVQIRDAGGRAWIVPDGDRDLFCPVDTPDSLHPDLPVWRVVMAASTWAAFRKEGRRSTREFVCTFVPDGSEVFHGATIRYRGNNSRNPPDGRMSYRVELAPGHRHIRRDRFIINAFESFRQKAGGDLMRLAGLPAPRVRTIRLKTPDIDDARYVDVEVVDSEFLEDKFGDDGGLLFRGYRGSPVAADFKYHGDDLEPYRKVYRQRNHSRRTDMGGLVPLLKALAAADEDGYVDRVREVVDVNNWVTYFAANNLLGNEEGGLSTDHADDYFVYERPTDGRFVLIPWDHDTTFRAHEMALFRPGLEAIRRLLRHREFAPLFHRRVQEMLAGPFSLASLERRLRAMAGSYRAEDLDALRQFARRRHGYLSSRMPMWPHATLGDEGGLGFGTRLWSTGARDSLRLEGYADPTITWTVQLGGKEATYDPVAGRWDGSLSAGPGPRQVWVDFLGSDGRTVGVRSVRIERAEEISRVRGSIDGRQSWTVDGGPYRLEGEVTVPRGAELRVGPGTEVLCAPEARLVVRGSVTAAGEASDPVAFRIEDWRKGWGGIRVDGGGVVGGRGARLDLTSCRFEGGEGGQDGFLRVDGGRASLSGCLLRGVRSAAIVLVRGRVELTECRIVDGDVALRLEGGEARARRCHLERLQGPGVDIVGTSGGVISFDSTVWRDIELAGSRVRSGRLLLRECLVAGCGTGVDVGGGADVRLEASTIVSCDRALAVDEGAGSREGRSEVRATGSVLRPNTLTVVAGAASRVRLESCHLAGQERLPRPVEARGSISSPPRFADPRSGDFSLDASSARRSPLTGAPRR